MRVKIRLRRSADCRAQFFRVVFLRLFATIAVIDLGKIQAYGCLKESPPNANPPKKSPTSVTSELQDIELEDQVRLRAYELYEARGRQDGHEMQSRPKIGSGQQSRNSRRGARSPRANGPLFHRPPHFGDLTRPRCPGYSRAHGRYRHHAPS